MDNMEIRHMPDFHRDSRGIERNQQLTMHLNRLALELLDNGINLTSCRLLAGYII